MPESRSRIQIRCQSLPVAFRFAARISQWHSDSLPDSLPDWRDTKCSRKGSRRPWHHVIIGSSESRVSLSALPTWSWHASIVLLVRPCERTPDDITKQRIWVGYVPGYFFQSGCCWPLGIVLSLRSWSHFGHQASQDRALASVLATLRALVGPHTKSWNPSGRPHPIVFFRVGCLWPLGIVLSPRS